MIKESVMINDVINLLNEAVELDRAAMENLIKQRVECNSQLAQHPTIQVQARGTELRDAVTGDIAKTYLLGILGVINGIFGTDEEGCGPIAASYDDDWNLKGFIRKE